MPRSCCAPWVITRCWSGSCRPTPTRAPPARVRGSATCCRPGSAPCPSRCCWWCWPSPSGVAAGSVTVRAAETTLGRGRLYRRARSRGHAGAALRAGTARRAAARVGLPRSAGATDVIDALARATGRPIEQVAGLLYGPPPTDDAGLLQLARQLDELESEVHRT